MPASVHRSIVVIVTLLLGSVAPVVGQTPQQNITLEDLAHQLEQTQRQLQQTQGELRQLRQRDQQREAWEEDVTRRLPPIDVNWDAASYRNAGVFGDADSCDACPDCVEDVCPGMPDLCGCCLEGLSWNKAGGWKIVPFGLLRGELIYSQAEQTADAIIFFLSPDALGVDDDQITVHGKTSMLNFAVSGPDFGNWQTGGAIVMNFTGSQPLRNNSGPQVLNAYGEVKNDDWRFAFGRMFDLFSPIAPGTVNMGQQRAAGNIGIYRGAMQLDRYYGSGDTRWTLSGRLSQPVVNDYLLLPTARGTDNGIPNFEGRVGLAMGPEKDGHRTLEVGISGLWGEARAFDAAGFLLDNGDLFFFPADQVVSTVGGGCVDFQLYGERVGFKGEVWMAQGAGNYFAGVLQTLNPETGRAIRSVGGWGEGYYKLNDCTTFHLGYGIDDPRNQDLGFITTDVNDPGQRTLNQVVWGNIMHNVTDFFQLGFEVSHRETKYLNPLASDEGWLFHFSSTLVY